MPTLLRLLPLLLALSLDLGAAAPAASTAPLNLLLIVSDDFTKYDGEIYGGQAKTPHLRQLARDGMLFTRCYQAAPSCSPTRHALYTGIYPVKSGAHPNHTFVYDGVQSVAHYLLASGYRAALSGKTHINPPAAFPFEYLNGNIKNNNPDFPVVDRFLGECVAAKKPFGLILCSNEPHTPWDNGDASAYPPATLKLPPVMADTPATRADYSKYLAEITYFDSQVGQALALLDRHGLRDNTLVIVVTEQGNAFPFAKWTCYDAGVGSGLIARWPGHIAPGSTSDALVEYIDVVPTFLTAAGLKVPAGLDGRSFLDVLTGQASAHKDYVYSIQTTRGINNGPNHYGIRSVRGQRYRYIRNLDATATFKNWATAQKWFAEWRAAGAAGDQHAADLVARYTRRPAEELYDCETDPWNQHNLLLAPTDAALLAIKTDLSTHLDAWMKAQGDLGQATEMAATERLWKTAGGKEE